jgi:hypothetical protein
MARLKRDLGVDHLARECREGYCLVGHKVEQLRIRLAIAPLQNKELHLLFFFLEVPLHRLRLHNPNLGDLRFAESGELLKAGVERDPGLKLGVKLVCHLLTEVERWYELEHFLD